MKSEPLKVFTTALTTQNMLCVAYCFDGGYYLNYYNMDMELIRKVDLNFIKNYLNIAYISIDYYGNKIFFHEAGETAKN